MPRRQAGHFSLIIYFYQASSFFFLLKNFSTTTKHTGIRKIPNSVLKVMPATTALPMDTRAPAPGPVATASG